MAASYVSLAGLLRKDKRVLDLLLRDNEQLLCRNERSGKTRKMLIRALHDHDSAFWAAGTGWKYYVSADVAAAMLERLHPGEAIRQPQAAEAPQARGLPGPNYGEEYLRIQGMPAARRAQLLSGHAERLRGLASDPDSPRERTIEALVDSSRDAGLVNKATLEEAAGMADAEARVHARGTVGATWDVVRAVAAVELEELLKDELFGEVVQKSNGTVVQHMTRVFVTGLAMLRYYNDQVSRANLAARIRVQFPRKYRQFYRALLPHLAEEQLTLERVFLGGVRALSDDELHDFAVGFLLHDIGKVADIEYHEGEEEYDREKVAQHVRSGYRSVMEKSDYPREAALITGYHHEYYNDPAGYGYFRALLSRYKEANPQATIDYAMAYDMEAIIDYRALSFFPAKMLEIVDVYDALTDPNRRYRLPLSPHDALSTMSEQFIQSSRRLDPILFDAFVVFIYTGAAEER